jgi:preprotein translocase subunit SecF
MLFALVFLGSESVRWFVLTLIVGCIVGTYSSIFLATPLLVYWRKRD